MTVRAKLVLETIAVLVTVLLITIAFSVMHPFVAAAGIAPLTIFFELALFVVLVGVAAIANRLNNRTLWDGLGFRLQPIGRQLLIGVALFVLTISFIIVPLLLGVNRADLLSFKARTPLILLYYAVHSLIFVGVGEELLWRGYFMNRAREITGSVLWAVVLSSALFGLWHYPIGQNVAQVVATALLGAVYATARWRIRGCSTMAVGLAHGLHDTAILILSYFLL